MIYYSGLTEFSQWKNRTFCRAKEADCVRMFRSLPMPCKGNTTEKLFKEKIFSKTGCLVRFF
ncbi:hypothetical protein B1H10_06965 [candidate division KSB1 bacterium 4484_188]|nr:MAG: hypothetical protein B1H10_06965 [candidate division KSB1 bacterium 4484_188]